MKAETLAQRQTNRKIWLSDLLDRLRMARGMQVTEDVEDFLAHELDRLHFTADQARVAEVWILSADWKYRGASYTLSLSDFTDPDMEAVRRVAAARGFNLRTDKEWKAAMRSAYETGKRDGLKDAMDVRPSEAVKDLCMEVLELKEDLASLGEQLAKESEARQKAEARLDRLRQRISKGKQIEHG